jgi:hypothetical protein
MRNPNITRWLQEQFDNHESHAQLHEMQAHAFEEAIAQYKKKGTLPKEIRQKWNKRKAQPSKASTN